MTIAKLTARAQDSFRESLPDRFSDVPWTRVVAAGTLIAGAYLLVSGRRKAALAVAAAGTAVALLEDPEAIRNFWDSVPGYMQAGQKFLGRAEGFVEEIAAQGDHLRKVLTRVG